MLSKAIEIEAIAPFSIRVCFNDGRVGVHDCAPDIAGDGPIVRPLKDPAYFARVFLEFGGPNWPNGFDMCPDWLQMTMEVAGELHAAAAE